MPDKKIAIIGGDYGAQHAYFPIQILQTLQYDTDYVSPGKSTGEKVEIVYHWVVPGEQSYREARGRPLVITEDFEHVNAQDYEGLIIPGARAPEHLSSVEAARALVRAFDDVNKPIIGMCHGPLLLAAANVVDGVRCTGIAKVRHWLKEAGAEWVPPIELDLDQHGTQAEQWRGIVVDGNIITAPLKVMFPDAIRELLMQVEDTNEITTPLDQNNLRIDEVDRDDPVGELV